MDIFYVVATNILSDAFEIKNKSTGALRVNK